MSLIATSETRARTLSGILDAAESGSRSVRSPLADGGSGGDLKLVAIQTEWAESARSDDAGGSGIATAIELWPDEAGTDPLDDTANVFAISSLISATEIGVDDSIDVRVIVGSTITIVGTNYDNGDARVLAKTINGSVCQLTLDRALVMTTASGSVVLPGSFERKLSEQSLSPIVRERHNVGLAARMGGEWHLLSPPEAWVILDEDLSRATVSSNRINYETARATVLIDDGTGLIESPDDEQLTVSNSDESLTVAADTLLRVRLCGSRWLVLWAACVPSSLR